MKLSLSIVARNDDYMPDFIYRLETTLNHWSVNASELNLLNEFEIVITDWGSDIPLVDALSLLPEAQKVCRFIIVPKPIAGSDFKITLANNIGIRRCEGEYIMLIGGDTLMPKYSLENLWRFISGNDKCNSFDPNATLTMIPRIQIPWQFTKRKPMLPEWNKYFITSGGLTGIEEPYIFRVGGSAGAILASKKNWNEARGLNEDFKSWGYNDFDFFSRVSLLYPWLSSAGMGVISYHMEHEPDSKRNVIVSKMEFGKRPFLEGVTIEGNNDDNWGLKNIALETKKSCYTNLELERESDNNKIEPFEKKLEKFILSARGKKETTIAVRESIRGEVKGWNYRKDYPAFAVIASILQVINPRVVIDVGIRNQFASAITASLVPSACIYGLDDWPLDEKYSKTDWIKLAYMLKRLNYTEYVRFANTITSEGIANYWQHSPEKRVDFAIVHGSKFKTDAILFDVIAYLFNQLSSDGVILLLHAEKTGAFFEKMECLLPKAAVFACEDSSCTIIKKSNISFKLESLKLDFSLWKIHAYEVSFSFPYRLFRIIRKVAKILLKGQ